MFDIFKSVNSSEIRGLVDATLRMHDMYRSQGYEEFLFDLRDYGWKIGDQNFANQIDAKISAFDTLLTTSFRATNDARDTGRMNKKIYTMLYTRIATSVANLVQLREKHGHLVEKG